MSVNKVILIGHLGADPEIRYTTGGQPVCNFRIATSETWTDKNGQRQEQAEWHSIIVWGKQGENCKQYLAKGRQVYVEGKIKTRQWTDKDNVTRYTTEITADNVRFLGGGGGSGSSGGGGEQRQTAGSRVSDAYEHGPGGFSDDDIPF